MEVEILVPKVPKRVEIGGNMVAGFEPATFGAWHRGASTGLLNRPLVGATLASDIWR